MKQDSPKALAKGDTDPASGGGTSRSNLEERKCCSKETSVWARRSDWERVKELQDVVLACRARTFLERLGREEDVQVTLSEKCSKQNSY